MLSVDEAANGKPPAFRANPNRRSDWLGIHVQIGLESPFRFDRNGRSISFGTRNQVETEKTHGRHPWDAVVEATTHRFRPILLTAAAAILGMIPIAPTIFWGPMAYAIMGGLAVATLLTLVFLPALYVAWFRIKAPHLEARQRTGLEQAALSSP